MFERSKAKKELDGALAQLQMNLENNYKDLAIAAEKEVITVFERIKASGLLKEKELLRYEKQIEEYREKMKNYSHEDISKFLKNRY